MVWRKVKNPRLTHSGLNIKSAMVLIHRILCSWPLRSTDINRPRRYLGTCLISPWLSLCLGHSCVWTRVLLTLLRAGPCSLLALPDLSDTSACLLPPPLKSYLPLPTEKPIPTPNFLQGVIQSPDSGPSPSPPWAYLISVLIPDRHKNTRWINFSVSNCSCWH